MSEEALKKENSKPEEKKKNTKTEVSRWITRTRWFYSVGTLISFVLAAAACMSDFHIMLLAPTLAVIFVLANLYFYIISRKLKKSWSGKPIH